MTSQDIVYYAWLGLTNLVTICSILSLMLPAVEDFNDFPRFQKWYRLVCKLIIKWGSLDLRGKILEARGILKNGQPQQGGKV